MKQSWVFTALTLHCAVFAVFPSHTRLLLAMADNTTVAAAPADGSSTSTDSSSSSTTLMADNASSSSSSSSSTLPSTSSSPSSTSAAGSSSLSSSSSSTSTSLTTTTTTTAPPSSSSTSSSTSSMLPSPSSTTTPMPSASSSTTAPTTKTTTTTTTTQRQGTGPTTQVEGLFISQIDADYVRVVAAVAGGCGLLFLMLTLFFVVTMILRYTVRSERRKMSKAAPRRSIAGQGRGDGIFYAGLQPQSAQALVSSLSGVNIGASDVHLDTRGGGRGVYHNSGFDAEGPEGGRRGPIASTSSTGSDGSGTKGGPFEESYKPIEIKLKKGNVQTTDA